MGHPDLEELDEGEGAIDTTGEEQEAITGPTGGPSLLTMIGQWLLKDAFAEQSAEVERATLQIVNQQVEERLKGLGYLTMALQTQGEIAYAQVTVKRTTTQMSSGTPLVVYDLKATTVSSWFRQDSKDTSPMLMGGDIVTRDLTNSFALPLSPNVIKIAAADLQSQIDQFKGATSAQSQQQRAKLGRCKRLLLTKGPHVPSFGHLGSECIDVLPMGKPPGG